MTRGRPDSGPLRVVRTVVLGAVSLGLGTAAHLVGGGALPSVGLLAVAGLVLGMVAVALTASRCRFVLLLAALTIEQIVLHVVLAAAGHAAIVASAPSHLGHAGTLSVQADPMATDPAMWIAHLAATLGTAWLLARGEAHLWALAELIIETASVRQPGTRRRTRPGPIQTPLAPLIGRALHLGTPRRGPPESFASA